jgi:hypothetical protein
VAASKQEKKPEAGGRESVTLTGKELIQLIIFTPVVITWLFLAARIIWSATSSAETLDNIEGLLTALAVLTIPVSAGLGKIFEADPNNNRGKKDGGKEE